MTPLERVRDAAPGARFAWLYILAWLAYLVAYSLALGTAMHLNIGWATVGALANTLPPGLLGWAVFRFGRSLSLERRPRRRFFAAHAAAATAYAVVSAVGSWLLLRVAFRAMEGRWDWSEATNEPLVWHLLMSTLLYALLAGLGHASGLARRLREEEARLARARELAARAELEALRARLDPHFLFNTLHSLLALVRSDPQAAEEGLERFGELLHYTLRTRGASEEVSLAEEWAFVEDFLALEALRLADRLRWEKALEPDALTCAVPAFTVQPLVENAVRYAIAPRAGGGSVRIRAAVEGESLAIEVSDDGPGADPDEIDDGGEGLELVRDRLQAVHGSAATLSILNGGGRETPGLTVRVTLPIRPAPAER